MNGKFVFNTAIAFIIFNRLDTTMKVFEVIREMKPPRLYLIADAPRYGREEDESKVKNTRQYVESHIDWECEVYKNYAEENMGCKRRIASGLDWVFSKEEYAIILEDDILPVRDFFRFCQEMLIKYKNNQKVMMISGLNLIDTYQIKEPYTFSCFSSIWGWATWKRAWKKMDVDMKNWPNDRKAGKINYVANPISLLWIKWNLEYCYRNEIDSWAYPWGYARYRNDGLGIVPRENLIVNIGTNHEDAAHMKGEYKYNFKCGSVSFPIELHPEVKRNMKYDREYIRVNFNAWTAWKEWNKKAVGFIIKKLKRKV